MHNEHRYIIDQMAPEVARHLNCGDGPALTLLALPTLGTVSLWEIDAPALVPFEQLLPLDLHAEAIRQFAHDILADLPEAHAVRFARDEFNERLNALVKVTATERE